MLEPYAVKVASTVLVGEGVTVRLLPYPTISQRNYNKPRPKKKKMRY